ncbi:hypothetical protein [Rufibacter soli]
MITNIPNYKDYEKIAVECWAQAIDTLYSIDKQIDELGIEEELTQEIYDFSQPHYRTAIVLLHQGIEAIMKGTICNYSPMLLIDNKRTDWPVLPTQRNKDFNELFTIGAESLLYTYCAVVGDSVTHETVIFLERIRKLRNEIVHGFNSKKIKPKEILKDILNSYTTFIGKDEWWNELRRLHWEHPLMFYYDSGSERSSFAERLNYVLKKLGKGEFLKHSSFNIKQRRYICPFCKNEFEREYDDYDLKWAILKPNTQLSTTLVCYNCDQETEIIRKECTNETCEGNVIHLEEYNNFCMTCGHSQSKG